MSVSMIIFLLALPHDLLSLSYLDILDQKWSETLGHTVRCDNNTNIKQQHRVYSFQLNSHPKFSELDHGNFRSI